MAGAWSRMVRAVRNDGRGGICSMAVSAVDLALWDLKARLLDAPLFRLLGAVRDRVPVCGSGGFTSYDDGKLEEQLGGWSTARASPGPSMHAHVAASIQNLRQVEHFSDHARVEQLLFDRVLGPDGGALRPDPDRPGNGLELRRSDAERYRTGRTPAPGSRRPD